MIGGIASATAGPPDRPGVTLRRIELADLPGFSNDDALAAWQAFARSCEAITAGQPELRKGAPPPPLLQSVCAKTSAANPQNQAEARQLFAQHFDAYEILPDQPIRSGGPAFFTGYYEPVVNGALEKTAAFTEPLRARPPDLVTLGPEDDRGSLQPELTGARRMPDGSLVPFPERSQIDAGMLGDTAPAVAWVRDPVEVFLIQVQGSAAIRLPDGSLMRLTYAGRNGLPYTSIGRELIQTGEIAEADMTLARLKQWVRDHGQTPGGRGLELLHRNKSYVFFSADASASRAQGPIGAAGVPLTPGRSIAVDRGLWPYGLPFWIEADLPEPAGAYRRLMIAQDTGSAILGPARADLFMGSGEAAGRLAGDIRHTGRMIVLWPRAEPQP
jgi:membrane-bound lytic murein transglycosylase A